MTAMPAQIKVRVQPRSRRSEIAGERAGAVLVRVTAPPVDGKANEALCRLIAKRAGVPRRAVEVVRGQSARDKVVSVDGIEPPDHRHDHRGRRAPRVARGGVRGGRPRALPDRHGDGAASPWQVPSRPGGLVGTRSRRRRHRRPPDGVLRRSAA
ncbi:MAG: DUF167 domain-containing protein [Actinobacteria bacterium]|nr:MAG: DUF167 domain-containing protein [Actinomycetota bacterium]